MNFMHENIWLPQLDGSYELNYCTIILAVLPFRNGPEVDSYEKMRRCSFSLFPLAENAMT